MSQPVKVLESGATLRAGLRGGWPARQVPASLKRMINGASLVLGGTLVGQVSSFAFNAVGAHALGPARYGVLAASMALLSFATPLLAAVQTVASREATTLAARKELGKVAPMLRHYGLRVTCGAVALGGLAAAASSWISGLFHLGSPWFVVIVAATIPCYVVSHLLGGLLQGVERFGRFALESVAEGSAKAILGVLAMGLWWRTAFSGVATVTVSCAVGLVTYLLLTLPLLNRSALSPIAGDGPVGPVARDRGALRRKPGREGPGVARYSVTALATYGLLALMLSSDTLVAKHYLSGHLAGLYAGVSLTGKMAYFAASSLIVVAFPLFSRHHDHGVGSGKWILLAGGLVCAVAGTIVTLFALEPAWVVIPLLGDRYRAAEGYVPWMAAVFGLYALGFLVSIYLLARKRRSVIAVLALAVVVQFAGFFAFHSKITSMISVLAVAFGVVLAGGILLVALGGAREVGTTDRGGVLAGALRVLEPVTELATAPAGEASRLVPGLPGAWREQIVTEVVRRVGSVPVLLAGSRALGTAHAGSDCDVAVVLPLLRIPRAAAHLVEAAGCLSAGFGVRVSVNPVPRFRMRRPKGSLFVRKLRAEGIVLTAPPGWSLCRQPLTGVTKFAASSALISGTQSLLQAFDTSAIRGGPAPSPAGDALRKAALHVAQVRLLRSGSYASDLETALARLRSTPPSGSGDVSGAELSASLTSGLMAVDAVEGFLRLRQCIIGQLSEISDAPLSLPIAKSVVRNAQYAALARLRGRNRWRVALRRAPVEAALAATQLALLRALDPGSVNGLDAAQLRLAIEALPVTLPTRSMHSWEDVRDLALGEWPDAHPLVGLLA